MGDNWKTPRQPRLVGHLNDASGRSVAISVERHVVIISYGGQKIRLGVGERDMFSRLYFQAELEADAWTKERATPAADVVEAEILCGDPGECANGPEGHLWQGDASCRDRGDAAGAADG